MGCYAVAAMLEEPPSVACRHLVESSAHRLYERLAGTRPGPPQERLELGKRFFYGVEIGPLRIRSIVRRETSKYLEIPGYLSDTHPGRQHLLYCVPVDHPEHPLRLR
jgi:hypothetical protein